MRLTLLTTALTATPPLAGVRGAAPPIAGDAVSPFVAASRPARLEVVASHARRVAAKTVVNVAPIAPTE